MILTSFSDLPKIARDSWDPTKSLSYLVISDIHLGKKSVPARFLIQQLEDFFVEIEKTNASRPLDVLFIAGDLFDQALSFTSEDVFYILQWLRKLLKWSASKRIRVRILEGTPSHDRSQPKNIVPLAKSIPQLDFEYIPTMCVEWFEDLGITCLYVPDEFAGSALKAQELIDEHLQMLRIEKVSMAIMHGMFKYQVPELASERFKYDEDFILDRVHGYINIGHVHIPSTYRRILCQGSFGRLNHGEEHPKGAILVHHEPDGQRQHFFLENKGATVFKTIKVTYTDLEKAAAQLHRQIKLLPAYSHVRVRATRHHAIFNVLDQFKREYSTILFTKISQDESESIKLIDDTLLHADYTPVHLHKDNIVPMIMDKVRQNAAYTGKHLQRLEQKLLDLR